MYHDIFKALAGRPADTLEGTQVLSKYSSYTVSTKIENPVSRKVRINRVYVLSRVRTNRVLLYV